LRLPRCLLVLLRPKIRGDLGLFGQIMTLPLSVGCRKGGSFSWAISKENDGPLSDPQRTRPAIHFRRGEIDVSPVVVLELPSEEEIAVIEETEVLEYPRFIRRSIRYRNGITVLLWLDSQNRITRIEMRCEKFPLFFVGNQIVKSH
jgi:hypothetical protein